MNLLRYTLRCSIGGLRRQPTMLPADGDFLQTNHHLRFPGRKRLIHINVTLHALAQGRCPERCQLGIEISAESAEMFVMAIAQSEDCVGKLLHARKMLETELLVKRLNTIRSVAVAIGAGQNERNLF